MDLSIVIVTYNSASVIAGCLESVCTFAGNLYHEIIVVDNRSTDDTVRIVRERFPGVRLIENERNEGFGRANNIGVLNSTGELIAYVNADIDIRGDVFTPVAELFRTTPDAGIIGVQLSNADGSPQKSSFRFPSIPRRVVSLLPVYQWYIRNRVVPQPVPGSSEVGYVMGAFMVVRRKVVEGIGGGFDPAIFMYHEEMDFCYRARLQRWKILLFTGERVVHYGGHHEDPARRLVFIEGNKSLLFFYWKHYGRIRYRLLGIINIFICSAMIPYCAILGRAARRGSYRQLLDLSLRWLVRPRLGGE